MGTSTWTILDIMRYLLIALAVTAISAEHFAEDGTSIIDEFLETDVGLPCIPKTCPPVCKSVTKYVEYGAYKLPYQENVCEPDTKCLADKAACLAKLEAAMKAAEKDMIAKSKLANAAKATKAQKDAAAAAKKKEEAAAAAALAAAKAAFEAAEK